MLCSKSPPLGVLKWRRLIFRTQLRELELGIYYFRIGEIYLWASQFMYVYF